MSFSPERADIRFGCGLSPHITPPQSVDDMLNRLTAPDQMALQYPIPGLDETRAGLVTLDKLRRIRNRAKDKDTRAKAKTALRSANRLARVQYDQWLKHSILRWVNSNQGMLERLTLFWADHFTAYGKSGSIRFAAPSYVEDAIRPNLTGTFADLLIAAVTHPVMLHYLDQSRSTGPNSRAAQRAKRPRGLNENLAREVLELHTLGVDGPYNQADVRQLAELFTGLSISAQKEYLFRPNMAEPGPETILGRAYGGKKPSVEAILTALRDLAAHPATARHIARKLAVHFVSDTPPEGLVEDISQVYQASGGKLMDVYRALLNHPAAWSQGPGNIKPSFDFIASSLRALAPSEAEVTGLTQKALRRGIVRPLAQMGQTWLRPGGPDGWPEGDAAWATPQGQAARIRWAMAASELLGGQDTDPRAFAAQTLGPLAGETLSFAVSAAETRHEGIAITLISPAFQRR